ncbi:HNH endonuclease [Stenotrophomonas phage BUCT603B1]|nr:HNH endonuclease [Stenotrophomonas phage BUCT603B1]
MTESNRQVTAERVSELLEYRHTGELVWRETWNAQCRAGQVAGSLNCTGYRRIRIDGTRYRAHRLVWLLHTGKHPDDQLDHINGVRDDNRIENLRECTNAENARFRVERTRSPSK